MVVVGLVRFGVLGRHFSLGVTSFGGWWGWGVWHIGVVDYTASWETVFEREGSGRVASCSVFGPEVYVGVGDSEGG